MIRRPPRSTRTDPLFPYTTLFRSGRCARRNTEAAVDCWLAHAKVDVALLSPGGSRSNQRDNGGKQGTLVPVRILPQDFPLRSEEHTSELQSLMRISYAVFCLKKKNNTSSTTRNNTHSDTYQN